MSGRGIQHGVDINARGLSARDNGFDHNGGLILLSVLNGFGYVDLELAFELVELEAQVAARLAHARGELRGIARYEGEEAVTFAVGALVETPVGGVMPQVGDGYGSQELVLIKAHVPAGRRIVQSVAGGFGAGSVPKDVRCNSGGYGQSAVIVDGDRNGGKVMPAGNGEVADRITGPAVYGAVGDNDVSTAPLEIIDESVGHGDVGNSFGLGLGIVLGSLGLGSLLRLDNIGNVNARGLRAAHNGINYRGTVGSFLGGFGSVLGGSFLYRIDIGNVNARSLRAGDNGLDHNGTGMSGLIAGLGHVRGNVEALNVNARGLRARYDRLNDHGAGGNDFGLGGFNDDRSIDVLTACIAIIGSRRIVYNDAGFGRSGIAGVSAKGRRLRRLGFLLSSAVELNVAVA